MKWTPGGRSDDLEDDRGMAPPSGGGGLGGRRGLAVGGGSAVVVIVLALLSQVFGVNLTGGGGGDDQGPAPQGQSRRSSSATAPVHGSAADEREVQFVSFVLDDVQKTFEAMFRERGITYRHAHLVLFTEAIDTGCGESSSAVGPFYCPPDEKAYIDLTFFQELKDRFGAAGEFAQAYVLAHELGHHVQNLLGIEEQHRHDRDFSIKLELQADCFAGVWGHSTDQRHLLDPNEAQQAIDAAASIGDDRLQKMAGRKVNPETWTHGSSEERVRWFRRGFDSGRFEDCDTFGASSL